MPIGIRPAQLPALRSRWPVEAVAPASYRHPQWLTIHWCPGSLPILWFDLAKLLFDGTADPGRLFAQTTKFAERFEACLCVPERATFPPAPRTLTPGMEFLLGRRRFGATEESVGDFEGGFHSG